MIVNDDDDEYKFDEPSSAALEAFASIMPAFSFTNSTDENDRSPPRIPAVTAIEDSAKEEDDAFEFKLFKTSVPEKISIQAPIEATYPLPTRPMSYYFHEPTPSDLFNIQKSAIDGETVRELAQVAYPWNSRPRRLKRYTTSGELIKHDQASIARDPDSDKKQKRRWRPSKTRRDKFKQIKREEVERAQRLAQLHSRSGRSNGRGGGFGQRGRGRGSGHDHPTREVKKVAVTTGYPRKGGPPV